MAGNPKCDPLNNQVNVFGDLPKPGFPGFSLDINIPAPTISLPEGIPEDILEWLRRLKFNLPGGGLLQDIADSLQKAIAAIISQLLSALSAFLSVYNFVMALVELIMCIIDVLCALPNPYAVAKKVKRLIRKCIPIFISIFFPWFALILLILALIALLIALIEYIIELIKRLIEQLLRNIRRIKKMLDHGNANAALAIISKLADLMCLFEHIFTLLAVIETIIALIKASYERFSNLGFCDSNPDSTDNSKCCETVCTDFLYEPIEQIEDPDNEIWVSRSSGDAGNLLYIHAVYGTPLIFPVGSLQLIRNEYVILTNPQLIENLQFVNMLSSKISSHSNRSFCFFPLAASITASTEKSLIPYFVDVSFDFDPNDGNGIRRITVNDTVVTIPVTQIMTDIVAGMPQIINEPTGALAISGGKSVDEFGLNDFSIEYILSKQGQIIPNMTGFGTTDTITNVEYKLKINFDALLEHQLISFSCLPSFKAEKGFLDVTYMDKELDFSVLPDVGNYIELFETALDNYRKNITEETTEELQDNMNDIANNFKQDAENGYCSLLVQAIDPHSSDFELVPDLQFVQSAIVIKVTPRSKAGQTLIELIGSFTPPANCMNGIADKLKATVTFGEASSFSFDGYDFVAQLTSNTAGAGEALVTFDGVTLSMEVRPDDIALQPYIEEIIKTYSFVGALADEADPVRNESDLG